MEKVKLSTLSKDDIIIAEGEFNTITVEDILNDLDYYRDIDIFTTIPHKAEFNAEEIIESAIEYVQINGMYDGWDDNILEDITKDDIYEMQNIFDRVLARRPYQNISYTEDKLIEIDL